MKVQVQCRHPLRPIVMCHSDKFYIHPRALNHDNAGIIDALLHTWFCILLQLMSFKGEFFLLKKFHCYVSSKYNMESFLLQVCAECLVMLHTTLFFLLICFTKSSLLLCLLCSIDYTFTPELSTRWQITLPGAIKMVERYPQAFLDVLLFMFIQSYMNTQTGLLDL